MQETKDEPTETELNELESVLKSADSRCNRCDCAEYVRGNPTSWCGRCDHSYKDHIR